MKKDLTKEVKDMHRKEVLLTMLIIMAPAMLILYGLVLAIMGEPVIGIPMFSFGILFIPLARPFAKGDFSFVNKVKNTFTKLIKKIKA